MELLRGVTQEIKVSLPPTEEVTALVKDSSGVLVEGDVTHSHSGTTHTFKVPYDAVETPGKYNLDIAFQVDGKAYARTIPFSVVTPYLEMWEIKTILGATATDEEAVRVEAAVRHIINAHCGQEFDLFVGTMEERADGLNGLALSRRLIRLDKMSKNGEPVYDTEEVFGNGTHLGEGAYDVTGSGWYLRRTRLPSNGLREYTYPSTGSVITAPPKRGVEAFKRGAVFSITGRWGWEVVPDSVAEAARLLINDYACAEQMYRDRFLAGIGASDWSISYHAGAYSKTGNARANLLLSPYVVNRMKVI